MDQNYQSNIWKYYVYQFFSGFYLIESIGILFYLLAGISYLQLSIIEVIGLVVVVLLEIPSGTFADLIGRKYSVFIGLFLTGIGLILIAYGFSYVFFLIASFIGGIGASLISGADTALLYDSLKKLKKETQFNKVFGKGKSIFFVSVVIAAAVGSLIYVVNRPLVFYINGFIFILGAFFFLSMYEPKNHKNSFSLKKQIKHIKDSLKYTIQNKKLTWVISFSIFSGAFISIFHNMLRQPYMKSVGIDIAVFGILTSILFLSRSLVSYKTYDIEKRIRERVSLYFVVFLQSITFFAMAFINIFWAFIFVVIIYCIWSYQEVIMECYCNRHMNSKQRATLISIHNFFRSSFLAISFLFIGWIVDLTSISFSLYILSGASLLFGLILLFFRR
ncbi:MAG: MFS transporter [Candidatus Nanoarchaeia archaeon]|nr:MFS transporter [Candidatus Nanoarchaeia archaeon]